MRNHLENGDVIELKVRKEETSSSRARTEKKDGERGFQKEGINWYLVGQWIGFIVGLWVLVNS